MHEGRARDTNRRVAVKTINKRFAGEWLEANFVRRVQHEVDIYQHMVRVRASGRHGARVCLR